MNFICLWDSYTKTRLHSIIIFSFNSWVQSAFSDVLVIAVLPNFIFFWNSYKTSLPHAVKFVLFVSFSYMCATLTCMRFSEHYWISSSLTSIYIARVLHPMIFILFDFMGTKCIYMCFRNHGIPKFHVQLRVLFKEFAASIDVFLCPWIRSARAHTCVLMSAITASYNKFMYSYEN